MNNTASENEKWKKLNITKRKYKFEDRNIHNNENYLKYSWFKSHKVSNISIWNKK